MKIQTSTCPQCGYVMTEADIVHGDSVPPKPGDSSLCLSCGQILTFAEDLTLRKATPAEVKELMGDAESWRVITFACREISRRGPIQKPRTVQIP